MATAISTSERAGGASAGGVGTDIFHFFAHCCRRLQPSIQAQARKYPGVRMSANSMHEREHLVAHFTCPAGSPAICGNLRLRNLRPRNLRLPRKAISAITSL